MSQPQDTGDEPLDRLNALPSISGWSSPVESANLEALSSDVLGFDLRGLESPGGGLSVYEEGLTSGQARLQDEDGTVWDMPIPIWSGEVDPADQLLLERCQGPTLDVGCGPGRITAALSRRGLPALGVDVSALAVAMTRSRGGLAVRRDVFSLTLGERRWSHILLADGNIGIGGDPVRLLWRCHDLIGHGGSVLLDLAPPGTGLRSSRVRLVLDDRSSDWFPWAWLGVDAITTVAAAAGLAVREVWCAETEVPRWQAELVPAAHWPTSDPESGAEAVVAD